MKLKHFLITFCILYILALLISSNIAKSEGYFTPDYQKIDLMPILTKSMLLENDYQIIYDQTGIAKPIVEELKDMPDFQEKMLIFQQNYFTALTIASENFTPVTQQDYVANEKKEAIAGFEIAPYHNGYIFLTKSTYTMNWRHGHAGIVIDAKRGKLLEAVNPGSRSLEQDASKWRYYPTFKMMRLKDTPQTQLDEIARYASSVLRDLPYNIFADKNQGENPYETHCSLLVWQAFKPFGFDIDASDGLLVSPEDIANSPLLETLQIFGFNPNKEW
ncbi:hypothetical protein [Cellulosilyticum sp. I15G10I2]|uniref:hypothetical protein n=1 Tax=Cellulosilyticum sp. I15G10I2 TaxID=1892843 RepID=UPI0009F5BF78|nr:hypothetical protein [Cellulosilyticum sp. I15G10I2]